MRAVLTKTTPISQRSGVLQNWLQANYPGFIETLQIWTYWTITSRLSCMGSMLQKYR